MKIAVTGANGLLGRACARRLPHAIPGAEFVPFTHGDFDITDRSATISTIAEAKPDVLINCAAYAGVDKAETEPEEAYAVNAVGAGNVALACAKAGVRFVHVSSDYVFDGEKGEPYKEDDPIKPINAYAISKAEGEKEVLRNAPDALVARSAWLFGHERPNFVTTIIEKGRELGELNVVDDQFGSPTYTDDLADGIFALVSLNATGIVHVVNSGYCNWYELAAEAVRLAGLDSVKVSPVSSGHYKTAARRPKDTRLDSSLYARMTGATMRSWKDALAEFIGRESY